MVICDTDERHAPATHAIIKGALLLLYTPRLANALTRDGWESEVMVRATVIQPQQPQPA